jgi:hypothetical protein
MWARDCSVDSPVVVPDKTFIAALFVPWVPNTTSSDLRIKLMSMTPSSDPPWKLGTFDSTARSGS